MKRFLKIFSITLASLVGLVIVVVAAVVGIACHVVFTPAKLTPIVSEVAGQFVKAPYAIDEVDLTVVSTFPNVGLRVKGLYVMNPMEGAQSDTVLGVPELMVGIDLQQYLDSQRLCVNSITAENVMLNAYINEAGEVNWDVLRESESTEDDTTATVLPFDIDVESLRLTTGSLSFVDRKDSLDIRNASLALTASATADSTLSTIAAHVEDLTLAWEGLTLNVTGDAAMAEKIRMALAVKSNTWQIRHVLEVLPEQYARLVPKEIDVDGQVQLSATVQGVYDEQTMPIVDAKLQLSRGAGHYDLEVLPYELRDIQANLVAHVDLNDKTQTRASIKELRARTRDMELSMTGDVTEVLKQGKDIEIGRPQCAAKLSVSAPLTDLADMLPDSMVLKGQVAVNMAVQTRLGSDMMPGKVNFSGDVRLSELDVTMPSITAVVAGGTLSMKGDLDLNDTTNIPNLTLDYDLRDVMAGMDTISAHVVAPRGTIRLSSNRRDKTVPKMRVTLAADALEAHMGADLSAKTQAISIEANARYNKNGKNVLLQWNPRLNFDLKEGEVNLAMLPVPVMVPEIKFEYNNHNCHIDTSRIVLGKSDFALEGHLQNIGHWLNKQADLVGNLTFTSGYTDVDELLGIINSLSTTDSVAAENTPAAEPVAAEEKAAEKEADPFMVPQNISLALTTHIREASAFGQHLANLGGKLYVQDGVAVLEEIGFISEAAKLQLTGIYKTPRRDHIYVGLDYHMIDIDLQQLVAMVPQLDTLVPMLSALRGAAEFHIAAETYVNAKYELKPSTLRGACSIEGKNLVLLDNETFSTIAKLLMFSKKTENLVDSISAQITLYKDQVTVYPFCLSMDNYMVAVGGNHYLDMNFNYHASVLSPIYLGVDVMGNLDDLDIKLAPCRYAKDFKPLFHRDVDEKAAGIRKMISDSLKKNVMIE